MSRWILLICWVCVVTLEARRLHHQDHGHHASAHAAHRNHSVHHLHAERTKDNEKENSTSSENNENVCQTEACRQTAQFILKSMDESVDPCQDFHKYACGNWANNYQIPAYEHRWSAWDLLENTVDNQQKALLSKGINHDDNSALKISKKWYQSCVNTDELEEKGVKPLLNVLARIGGWPMAMKRDEWDEDAFSWQRVDKYYARLTGSPTFVESRIIPDWLMIIFGDKRARMVLQIGDMKLPFEEALEDTKRSTLYKGEDYKRLIVEAAVALAKERGVPVPRHSIDADIRELFKFEKKISKIFKNDEDDDEDFSDYDSSENKATDEYDSETSDEKSDDNSCDCPDSDACNNDDGETGDNNSNIDDDETGDSNSNNDDDETGDSNSNNDNGETGDNNSNNDDEETGDNNSNNDDEETGDNNSNNDSNNDDDSDYDDNDSESDSSIFNILSDSDVADDYVGKKRKIRRKVTEKRAKKFLGRRILSDYSYEDEDEAETEAEKDVMRKIIWGNSVEAILTDGNVKISDLTLRDEVSPQDLKKLYLLIEKTPKRVVVNFIHWKFISGMIQHTTEKLRKLHFDVAGRTLGVTEEKPRWLWCLDQVQTKEIISYEYVKNHFPAEVKNAANRIMNLIRQVIDNEIDKSPWMSEGLKKAAKEKLHSMKAEIGYPKWYDDAKAMNCYYKKLVIGHNYFDNVINYKKYEYMKILDKTNSSMQNDPWARISPLTLNAMYLAVENTIMVTAVDFQRPFFDLSQPAAVNFGIIGSVIGHEISHGFDPDGRFYDKAGKWRAWRQQDDQSYRKHQQCFVEKYNAYTVDLEGSNITVRVNGRKTVDDNVADCTGLEAVHGAYTIWREEQKDKKDQKLPGLEKFTNDQLFYLASAAMWCNSATPEYMTHYVEVDEHSPMSVRILGAISNNEQFSDAFNCPRGSPMNPEEKCSIWK